MNYAIVVASSLLSLAVSVPLSGALVRWRVHYAPSAGRIRLEDSEGQESSTPAVTGYFSTLRRVYRLEGWAGLYKGFSPTFVGAVFMMSILLSWLKINPTLKLTLPGKYTNYGVIGSILQSVLGLVVGIPMQVLTTRAIVTPYKLPYTKPLVACKLLLSPLERRRPWKIYLLPGVFVSQLATILLWTALVPLLHLVLVPLAATPLIGVAASVYFGFALLGSTLHTPLLVAQSRLAVQRARSFGEGGEGGPTEAEVAAAAGVEPFSSEDVITVRDEEAPYTGFVDCLNKMTAEEGWRTLFRAWWVTFLGFYFVAAL